MIIVAQKDFQKAVRLAGSIIERRNTIPVLGTMKAVANGKLTLTGTDLDMFASATLAYNGDEAELLIPEPAKVATATKKAGGDTITLSQAEKRLTVAAGELSADLVCSQVADDFPTIDRVADQSFTATVGSGFFAALNRVRAAISTEETRYYLNGVFIRKIGDWTYRLDATDGHRLFMAEVQLPDAFGELDGSILPRRFVTKAIDAFAKCEEGVRFTLGAAAKSNRKDATLSPANTATRCAVTGNVGDIGFDLVSKLIDGTYPDVSRVIPSHPAHTISFKRVELIRAIEALTPLSSERTRAVRLIPTADKLAVELHSPDIGQSRFEIAAQSNSPKDFTLGLNGQYLLEALHALAGDEVEIRHDDPAAPLTITDPTDTAFKVVQMPMRV